MKHVLYRIASAAIGTSLVMGGFATNFALAVDVIPVSNPKLNDACGLDIMLVMDRSGSIDPTEMAQMNTAAKSFVDAFLPSTPTMMGVVNFDATAVLDQALTSNVTDIKAKIDSPSLGGGLTNWEAAILAAKAELEGSNDRADATHPDLLIMFSDGDPTTSDGPLSDMDDAVVAANGAKTSASTMPIRILGVGIGSGVTTSSFEKITNGVGTSSIVPPASVTKDTDIILADFGTLATTLGNLANALCSPTGHQNPCCGDDTVENGNGATTTNIVGSVANTGGNSAGGSTGGDGGRGGKIKNGGGTQNVNNSSTGNGGNGGNAGVGGTVNSGDATANAGLMNTVNDNDTSINRCACPGNECRGGATIVRNGNGAEVGNLVGSGADTGGSTADGSAGGKGGKGGKIANSGGTQNVNGGSTGNGGKGGSSGKGEVPPGGLVTTGNSTSNNSTTNVTNRNVTRIGH